MELSIDERRLIDRAVHREPEAFSELYLRYQPSVLRHIYYVVGDADEASDITSEAFLRAWKAIERFEDRGVSIRAWLVKIAYNLATRHVKRQRRSRAMSDLDMTMLQDEVALSPDEATEKSFELQNLHRAILALPTIQRKVIVLRSLNQMGYDEVGAIIGKSSGAVRVIQHRAIRALRGLLQESDFRALSGRIGEGDALETSVRAATRLRIAQRNAN
jgi:RNA polymerase sigma-70 factor (ECF subfamily)